MRIVSTNQSSVSHCSLVIALLAAIAFASFQAAELGHQHMADDVAENCVLCKGDLSETILAGTAHVAFTGLKVAHNRAQIDSATVEYFFHKLPRAPPHYS